MAIAMLRRSTPPVAPLLDAWEALCAVHRSRPGRRCLLAREALEAGTEEQREALGLILATLGHPEAMCSARHLAKALERQRGRLAPDGRCLASSRGEGGCRWYVTGVMSPGDLAALGMGAGGKG